MDSKWNETFEMAEDKHPNTIIIDYDTNFDLINTPWNECLHPFLQLKYQNDDDDDDGDDDGDHQLYSALKVVDLKNEKYYNELCCVDEIRDYDETSLHFEENLFIRFHKSYDKLKAKLIRVWKLQDDIKGILLNSILYQWAFCLDEIGSTTMMIMTNNRTNKNEKSKMKTKIFELLEKFIKTIDSIDNAEDSTKKNCY
ncbi:unnamed protein product [Rotaria sp. Silwood1]|nr:unnamed protein product [Rotaria sp. Silwood1]CAF3883087.1 unnamed protein product [Rotaria sp. Silwood1]